MKIFPADLDIGETEGFTDKDIFRRSALGKSLTHFVGAVDDPMVIAVDAQWGSGKTTFLKMWAGELRNQGFPVVYFDAFEHDYFDDAFLAIAGEIISLAEEHRAKDTTRAQRFVSKAKGVAKILGSSAARLAVKGATMGAVDLVDLGDTVDKVIDATGSEAERLFDKHVEELLTRGKEQKDSIRQFREALSDLPGLLTSVTITRENGVLKPKPLILIVDELDRCRPVFGLQVLERIKHFFAVENVHFVLGVHLGQLRNSVVSAYGANIDARLYLEKFIHLTIPLVDTPLDPGQLTPGLYVKHLAESLGLPADAEPLIEEVATIANRQSFSLRTIERIMTSAALAFAFGMPTRTPLVILAGLCVLKVTHHDLFVKAKLGTLTFNEMRVPLTLHWQVNEQDQRRQDWVIGMWRYCLGETMPGEELAEFRSRLHSPTLERHRIIPVLANRIIDRLAPTK